MTNKELYEAFYNQTKYFRFGDFLESLYEKCDFCEEPCGNEWCPVIEEKEIDLWESFTSDATGGVLDTKLLENVKDRILKGEL